jgi:hypothetical protein
MPDFRDYFRGYQSLAAQPQPSRELIARRAVEKHRRQMEAASGTVADTLFKQALAQAAQTLTQLRRPTQPHYLGIPKGSSYHGDPFYTGTGFTRQIADGEGWLLQYRLWSSAHSGTGHSAFLRADGTGIVHDTDSDTIGVLPIDHAGVGAAGLDENSPEVQHEGAYYLMRNRREGWQTGVEREANEDKGFVVQDGQLMMIRSAMDYDWERTRLWAVPYADYLARLALGGDFQVPPNSPSIY